MKTIEQDELQDLKCGADDVVTIYQFNDFVKIDKQGAKQLIEVLKEWVGDENNQ